MGAPLFLSLLPRVVRVVSSAKMSVLAKTRQSYLELGRFAPDDVEVPEAPVYPIGVIEDIQSILKDGKDREYNVTGVIPSYFRPSGRMGLPMLSLAGLVFVFLAVILEVGEIVSLSTH